MKAGIRLASLPAVSLIVSVIRYLDPYLYSHALPPKVIWNHIQYSHSYPSCPVHAAAGCIAVGCWFSCDPYTSWLTRSQTSLVVSRTVARTLEQYSPSGLKLASLA